MTFSLDISIEKSTLINGERINLEMLLNYDDYCMLLSLFKSNHLNNYLSSLYALSPDKINFELTERIVRDRLLTSIIYYYYKMEHYLILYYVIKKNEEIIGAISLFTNNNKNDINNDEVEIGIFIGQEFARQGYGTEAVKLLIDFVRCNSQIKRIKWICEIDNVASINIASKCNFVYSGSGMFDDKRSSLNYILYFDR